MPKCKRLRAKHRKPCIGDFNKEIVLNNREITPPLFGSNNFDETFTATATVWARVDTVSGKTFFDGVNTDVNITHEIYVVFDSSITAETWVEYGSRRLDILQTENMDERNEFMKLTCVDRGLVSNDASKA